MNHLLFARTGRLALLATAALLAGCATSTPTPAPSAPMTAPGAPAVGAQATANVYDKPDSWLCRPGRQDVCAQALSVTTVAADGKRTLGAPQVANAAAPVDCFYVYPTVSNDPGANSDMQAGPEELGVAYAQFSPFRAQCRLFAPMYRQVTLAALRSRFTGTPMAADWALGYNDVLAAWKHYLANDNQGRGVVLVGHSQGSRVLTELVAKEIEGKPVQRNIISVIIPGANLLVPKGKDVGGSFQSTPLCRSATQTGCAIAYVSFRASSPPPDKSLFGRATGDNVVACTNPAALAGGSAQPKVWFSKRADVSSSTGTGSSAWQALSKTIDTPFFALPGLVSTRCVQDANGSYLAVQVQGDSRTDNIGGDVVVSGMTISTWGLHLIDMNLGLGDLIDVVGLQSRAYLARVK
ncbi:MAG: DUF3089 domain-containing protein [Cytophagales bacterium]|nr:DUF3089 domain-containing protein [Rhizobacter sp.]